MPALRSCEDSSTEAPVGARPSRMAQRLGLAPFLQQQERAVGIAHAHALDAIRGNDRDRIDHGSADRQCLHCPLWYRLASAIGTPTKKSSSASSHSLTPPVMPAALLTIFTCGGGWNAILRALPPPM